MLCWGGGTGAGATDVAGVLGGLQLPSVDPGMTPWKANVPDQRMPMTCLSPALPAVGNQGKLRVPFDFPEAPFLVSDKATEEECSEVCRAVLSHVLGTQSAEVLQRAR